MGRAQPLASDQSLTFYNPGSTGQASLWKSWQGSCRNLQLPALSAAGSTELSELFWFTEVGLCPAESFTKRCKAAPPKMSSL